MKLRRLSADLARLPGSASIDPETRRVALEIVDDVRARGDAALRAHAEHLGDIQADAPLLVSAADLEASKQAVGPDVCALLQRTADRIRAFAEAQRDALAPISVDIPGGRAGHTLAPVDSAGCYAPGGRFPLPSSVLMTAVTARVAGVKRVVVASPRPAPVTLAAAAIAGADEFLAVGGAQAISALAYGTETVAPVDFICGPGNRWVTAAKQLVFGQVGIDSLAGPSELVVLADETADPELVAADLIAQAEHDVDAVPILVTTSAALADAVDVALSAQLAAMPSTCAGESLAQGFATITADMAEAIAVCDRLAPEHLEVIASDAAALGRRLNNYGALFIGAQSAEVLGDYGAGPNHVLPTGGGSRFRGGLSTFDFLRVRTWMDLDAGPDAQLVAADAAQLARLEGLEGHARSAELRASGNRGT